MQHIPVVSHALLRGTFAFRMLDVVPAIQAPGSYHQQDLCLFTAGKSLTEQGSGCREVRGREHRRGFPLISMEERIQRACEWLLLTNKNDCAWLC